jgi:hypothetical protein
MVRREEADNPRGMKEAAFNALFGFNGSCRGLAGEFLDGIS